MLITKLKTRAEFEEVRYKYQLSPEAQLVLDKARPSDVLILQSEFDKGWKLLKAKILDNEETFFKFLKEGAI